MKLVLITLQVKMFSNVYIVSTLQVIFKSNLVVFSRLVSVVECSSKCRGYGASSSDIKLIHFKNNKIVFQFLVPVFTCTNSL